MWWLAYFQCAFNILKYQKLLNVVFCFVKYCILPLRAKGFGVIITNRKDGRSKNKIHLY